jgi:hypothetical protein
MRKFYIPYNLEIETLINEIQPTFKPFKIDKLLYILSLIFVIPIYNNDLKGEDFTPLNSTLMQRVVQNYKNYLNYLEFALKIIESDNHYIVGAKSKGFRFVQQYRTKVKIIPIQDFILRKKLKISLNRKIISCSDLKYLTKWFGNGLEIDFKSVQLFLENELRIKSKYPELRDLDKRGKLISPINQYNFSIINAEKIVRKEFNLIRDSNVGRLHSNLTNMRSVLRNALTYKGEKLISIDLKNSQPYLSIGLLNHNIINNILNYNNYYYIMLGETLKSIDSTNFEDYISLVSNGSFYNYLEQKLSEKGLVFHNYKSVKQTAFQVLFTDNRFIGQKEAAPKRVFKELFPEVYKVFSEIKKNDKTLLPRVLQYVESRLFLEKISLKLSKEFPDAPIFTIHDSVATTAEYVGYFKPIVSEVLEKAIGYEPTLHVEEWKLKNMDDYIQNLRNCIIKTA